MLHEKCVRCGSCVKFCPAFEAGGEEQFSPRGKIYLLQVMDLIENDEELKREFRRVLFQCTMCARCEEVCSSGVDLLRIWHEQRLNAFETAPDEFDYLDSLKKALRNVHNIYGLPPEDRAIYWMDEIEADIPNIEDRLYEPGRTGDIVLFLGCLMSFRSSQIDVLRSLLLTLERMGADYLVMGAEEFCCGHPLDLMGDKKSAADLRKHNKKVIESTGAGTVVTCCPGCLMQLKENHNLVGVEPLHHTQFLDRHFSNLPAYPQASDERLAYHDPCELHRLCDVKTEPRSLLRKMDVDYRELELSCCGGGGLLRLTDPDLSDKIVQLRARKEQLQGTTVVTCCPSCREQFLGNNMATRDIVELVASAFERGDE